MQDQMMTAFRRGDYEAAVTLAPDPVYRATMLMQLGRIQEAEVHMRQAAGMQKEPKLLALIQSGLGQILLLEQRGDEAMECFHASLKLWPERGSTHRDIAEALLRRGDNPDEALRWAKLAVEKEKAGTGISEECKSLNLGEDLATLAWAVAAQSHDAAEVERIADELELPGTAPMTTFAQTNYHFGKAWEALGDSTRSAAHFEMAARVDPKGIWGRQAAAMTVAAHQ